MATKLEHPELKKMYSKGYTLKKVKDVQETLFEETLGDGTLLSF